MPDYICSECGCGTRQENVKSIICVDCTSKIKEAALSASANNRSAEIAWVEEAFDMCRKSIFGYAEMVRFTKGKDAVIAQLRTVR